MSEKNTSNNQPSQPQGSTAPAPVAPSAQPERVTVPAVVMEVRNGSQVVEKKGRTQ